MRDAPPCETARRKARSAGSGAGPVVDGLPAGWRSTWKEPRGRTLKQRQLAGMSRGKKFAALERIVDSSNADDMAVLKAIEIDNRMQGHNEPERVEHDVSVEGGGVFVLLQINKGGAGNEPKKH